jgi:putative tryptophan/tyrosine transport system substrate-binding protein
VIGRRGLIAMLGGAAASWPFAVRAQQPPTRTYRVGIVWANTPVVSAPRFTAFRQGLSDLGYVDGKNIVFVQRGPNRTLQREELNALVAELVSQKLTLF